MALPPGEQGNEPGVNPVTGDDVDRSQHTTWAEPNGVTDPLTNGNIVDTDNDHIPDKIDVTPTGGQQYAYNPQAAAATIKNWPQRWNIKFNPPIIRYASGDRVIAKSNLNHGRATLLDSARQGERVRRKGYIIPDTSFPGDWMLDATDVESLNLSRNSLLPIGSGTATLFGFKFMYNPTTLDFNVSTYDGINPGYLMSGKETAMPVIDSTGSVITVTFPITRIDDMRAIKSVSYDVGQVQNKDGTYPARKRVNAYSVDNVQALYGTAGAYNVTPADIQGIAEKGTMYDLEYLFRTCLGRQWKTVYRGNTADVGIIFSLPLKLWLSDKMVYRARLRGISFSHKSFTPEMIPLYTDVQLSFERIPDALGVV